MWRLILPLVVVGATAPRALAGPSSNPAFLGIAMDDLPGHGCFVTGVTPDSAADRAGVLKGDLVLALDGVATSACTDITAQIIAHRPGDDVRIDVRRGMEHVVLHAVLVTRAEVLNEKYVGHELDTDDVVDLDDGTRYDLAHLHGRTHVLVWFDARECADCAGLIRRVLETTEARHANLELIGVTYGEPKELADLKLSARLGIPVAVAPDHYFTNTSMFERDRAYFMVIDARGTVRFVTPIVPEADDLDAEIDEVLAAADQAESRLRR